MKSIANQYLDLKEGRMSQFNFMRSLRMTMPQYITNVTSFNDAVKILRNKAILTESDLSRDAELGGVEEDFKNLLAKGYSYSEALELIAQNTGMDPDELESMLPQDAVDTEGYEDEDDELDAIISRMGGEEEADKAIKGGFGIYDPLEEADGQFPRDPREMAQAIADEFGDELLSLSGREREKMAISRAYEKILNSGHPKAKIIARNLAFGYADEDWPMDYVSALNQKLKNPTPEIPGFEGTRDDLDSLSIREEEINESEYTYRKIDGVCYKIDDENNRTRVNDRYCRYNEDLTEGRKKKEPKKELHPNQIHPQELRMGMRVELEHTDDLDKAKKIALDHLAENPFYYTALKLAGVDSPSAPKVKAPVEKKAKKRKEAVELVDKINAMQKVKMPKIVKENLNEAGGEFMFSGTLTDKEAAELRRIAPGVEIEQDELDDTYKTVVSHPMYNEKTLRHAVKQATGQLSSVADKKDLGASFDKLKSQLESIVREVMNEMYDGGSEDLAAMARSSNALRHKPETQAIAKKAAESANNKEEAASLAVKLAKAKGITDSEQITHIVDLATSKFMNETFDGRDNLTDVE